VRRLGVGGWPFSCLVLLSLNPCKSLTSILLPGSFPIVGGVWYNNNNNNNIYLLQLGCQPVAVVILHVNKT